MNDYLSCYRFYCPRKRRIAAFGKEKDGQLEIFLLYCSKNDQFDKDWARKIYTYWLRKAMSPTLFHPEITIIPLQEGSAAKYTFIKYLEERFYKKTTFRMIMPGQKMTISRTYNKGLPLSDMLYIETEKYYKVE